MSIPISQFIPAPCLSPRVSPILLIDVDILKVSELEITNFIALHNSP